MYHRLLNILIVAQDTRLETLLRRVAPLERFSHRITRQSRTNDAVIGESSIIILDSFTGSDEIRQIHAAKNSRAVLIACFDAETFPTAAETYDLLDQVWIKPSKDDRVLASFRAILTRFKEREDAALTENYLDTLIDSLPDLIWFKDVRGAHLKVNSSFCRTVDKTREEIRGRGHYYIWGIEPDEYARGEYVCLDTEKTVLNRKETCLFDETVKCHGELRQFKTYKSPLFDNDGEIIGTVGIARDVTDLQNLHIELSILLKSLPFAVIVTDRNKLITHINDKSLQLFPHHKGTLPGTHLDTFIDLTRNHAIDENWMVELSGDETFIFSRNRVLRLRNEQLLDVFGEFAGYLLLFLDVTREYSYKNKLIEDANTDFLTKLNNRRSLHDFLRRTPCTTDMVLLLADLDNFKQINDQYGHDEGDRTLVAFAEILVRMFPPEVLFRLGGDEFAVILGTVGDGETERTETVRLFAEQLMAEFDRYVAQRFHHAEISVSIGIAIHGDDDEDFGSLFKKADIALYHSKKSGKSTFTFWNREPQSP